MPPQKSISLPPTFPKVSEDQAACNALALGARAVLADQLTGIFVKGDPARRKRRGDIRVGPIDSVGGCHRKRYPRLTMAEELVKCQEENTELVTHVVHPNYVGVRFFIELVLHTLGPNEAASSL